VFGACWTECYNGVVLSGVCHVKWCRCAVVIRGGHAVAHPSCAGFDTTGYATILLPFLGAKSRTSPRITAFCGPTATKVA
jgi:hypothetical protein